MDKLTLGALAGAVSAFVFTIIHQWIISNIWFMLVPMLIAGALCGIGISWSYTLLVPTPTARSWAGYNTLYLILLYLLAPISLLIYDPVMSFQEVLTSPNGLPDELARTVTPFVILYTLTIAVIISARYGWRWDRFLAVLAAAALLMLLLGMNIAAMGLIELPTSWPLLLLEQVALIVSLTFVYALTYWGLSQRLLATPSQSLSKNK